MSLLSLLSAVMRLIGNSFKFLNIIGGKYMRNLKNIIETKLALGIEILLVAGNTRDPI